MDTLQPAASQAYATRILLPASLAWCIQLCLGSVSTTRAVDLLLSGKKKLSVPYARLMLALATVSNVAAVLISAWCLIDFVVVQDRSFINISYARVARAFAPLPIGFTAAITQVFMAIRCWRIANRSIIFGIVVSLLIFTTWGAAIAFAALLISRASLTNLGGLVAPQIFSWAGLLTDTIITSVLVYNLWQMKRDSPTPRAAAVFGNLIRVAFETCAIPSIVVLAATLCGTIAFWTDLVRSWYWALCLCTPALYLLSFIYCLEATIVRLQNGIDEPDDPNGSQQPNERQQCLCAYIQPFTLGVKSNSGSRGFDSPMSRAQAETREYVAWALPHNWATEALPYLRAPGEAGKASDEYARGAGHTGSPSISNAVARNL